MKADFARKIITRAYALLQMFTQRGLNLRDDKENEEMIKNVSFFYFFV